MFLLKQREKGKISVLLGRTQALVLCVSFLVGCSDPATIINPITNLHPAHPSGEEALEPKRSTVLIVDDDELEKVTRSKEHSKKGAHHAHHVH